MDPEARRVLAEALIEAFETGNPIVPLPPELVPADAAAGEAVAEAVLDGLALAPCGLRCVLQPDGSMRFGPLLEPRLMRDGAALPLAALRHARVSAAVARRAGRGARPRRLRCRPCLRPFTRPSTSPPPASATAPPARAPRRRTSAVSAMSLSGAGPPRPPAPSRCPASADPKRPRGASMDLDSAFAAAAAAARRLGGLPAGALLVVAGLTPPAEPAPGDGWTARLSGLGRAPRGLRRRGRGGLSPTVTIIGRRHPSSCAADVARRPRNQAKGPHRGRRVLVARSKVRRRPRRAERHPAHLALPPARQAAQPQPRSSAATAAPAQSTSAAIPMRSACHSSLSRHSRARRCLDARDIAPREQFRIARGEDRPELGPPHVAPRRPPRDQQQHAAHRRRHRRAAAQRQRHVEGQGQHDRADRQRDEAAGAPDRQVYAERDFVHCTNDMGPRRIFPCLRCPGQRFCARPDAGPVRGAPAVACGAGGPAAAAIGPGPLPTS